MYTIEGAVVCARYFFDGELVDANVRRPFFIQNEKDITLYGDQESSSTASERCRTPNRYVSINPYISGRLLPHAGIDLSPLSYFTQ